MVEVRPRRSHGRQTSVVDARAGATTCACNAADLVASVTTPAPSFAEGPQTTRTWYNKMLQATNVVQPDGSSVFTGFYLTGELKRNYGSRTYPVEYTYDYAGRMKTMKTWKTFARSYGAALTTWNYDSQRGWLSGKRYADNTGPDYTYTPGGRLKTRAWARGVLTTYTYGFDGWEWDDKHGDLVGVEYSNDPQGTPAAAYTLDRTGRQTAVTQDATTVNFAYNAAGGVVSESYSGGPLNGVSVTNGYDHLLRRTNLTLRSGGTVRATTTYGYDAASRLSVVAQPSILNFQPVSATYSYLAQSPLVGQIVFTNNGQRRMTTTKTYDFLNRLLAVSSAPSAASAVDFEYSYNAANQRTLRREVDDSYWRYEYDSLGQVISGKKFWADGTPVAGQQFEYAFDDIGNRTGTKAGGDASGADLRAANYNANNLNQYTSRTVPGAVDVIGVSYATNTVTVNGQAAYRKGEYFRKEVSAANSSAPVWQSITVAATGQTNVTGSTFVRKTPEAFGYDLDGNLTNDGRWAYTWDAENRLVRMVARTSTGPQQRLDFGYDWRGRRISKKVWNNTGGTGSPTVDQLFTYDGWNLISILNSSFNIINSFAWGLDLSGSLQGAGGVGGLLWMNDASSSSTHLAAFDGNGNVVALFNATDSSETARYEYGPFGELVRTTGPARGSNPFRFSTKYQDDETDLVYYLFRFYSTSAGGWLSRDPAGQLGEENPYIFVKDNPISLFDVLGLWGADVHKIKTMQWSGELGIDSMRSQHIGATDDGVDSVYSTFNFDDWNWSWHFNRAMIGDSRLTHRDLEVRSAKAQCTGTLDNPYEAATHLGRALLFRFSRNVLFSSLS